MDKSKDEKFFEEVIKGFVSFWNTTDSNTTDEEFKFAFETSFKEAEKKIYKKKK
jgi:hypothetical protein